MNRNDVQGVREFSRFYTNVIGLLNQHLLDSPFPLPEARILYELGNNQPCTASDLMERVTMDRGYMSRILSKFERKKLILRKKSTTDGRAYFLSLTAKGESAFRELDQASHQQVETLLKPMSEENRQQLLKHMRAITTLLTTTQQ
jgi:DNA-binding MarR family transcriptional regulator